MRERLFVPEDPSKRRPPTFSGHDDRRDRRNRASAGAPSVPRGEFDPEDLTGRFEGAELERLRAERDKRVRDDLRALQSDVKENDALLVRHNYAIEEQLKPAIATVAPQLEAIRLAQTQLNAAVEAAVTSSHEAARVISLQLQDHNHRIGVVETDGRANATQIAAVERTATDARSLATEALARTSKLEKRSAQQGADLRRWWRRHLGKAAAAALMLIASAIAGAISARFRAPDSPPVDPPAAHIGGK